MSLLKSFMLFLFILQLTTAEIFSQNYSQIIRGRVIDIDSRAPLHGANIILLDSLPVKGTTSGVDGKFRLDDVPVGKRSFKISFLGYEDVYINDVVTGTVQEVVLNVQMQSNITSVEEVKVVADAKINEALNSMATISARQMTVDAASRIAAGINDPARVAQSYAGVSSADDQNNILVVRGNSPRGMLWRLEGIDIPNPNHFSSGEGGTGGGICAISTEVLSNSDFFTGAFPAEYGSALSGVFDLKLRNGNPEKSEYTLQIGVMGAQIGAEGPIKKGSEASYLFNYRYSTLELLSAIGINIGGGSIIPKFQDLSYKIHLPTKKIGRFSLWGVGGISSVGKKAERDSLAWESRGDRFSETENHYLHMTGVTHNYPLNSRTYIRTIAAYSYTNNTIVEDSLDNNYEHIFIEGESFKYNVLSLSSLINHRFSRKNVARIGIIYRRPYYDFYVEDYNSNEHLSEKLIDASGNTSILQSYFQWQHRLRENILLNAGLHYTYIFLNNDFAVEPRIGLKWKISDRSSINFGAGLHSKEEPISIYLAEKKLDDNILIYPNKDIKLTKAMHIVAGYSLSFAEDFNITTEIYYQHLYDVPVMKDDTTGTFSSLNFDSGFTNDDFVNKGTGRNYGIEFTFEKYFSRNYYILLTSSLFESKYTMSDNKERNTRFNSKYIYNLVGGKEFILGKNKQCILGANIRVMWRGGYRTVPVDYNASRQLGREIRDYSRAFETKAPDYFRADIGLSVQKNNKKWFWIFSANIQNLTNRLNIWDEKYSSESGRLEKVYMNGLIPVINYRVGF